MRRERAPLVGLLFVALLVTARFAHAQDPPPIILQPGEARENIGTTGRVLQVQGNHFLDFRSWASVGFERDGELGHNIKLEAKHPIRYFPVFGTAIANGMLFVDFCVPTADAAGGTCGSEPATPEIITAVVSFSYGIVGRISTFGFTSQATFQATGRVIDLTEQRSLNYQELLNLSVKGGVKTIKMIPIPIPALEDAVIVRPVTFTSILKRGRRYRFQFGASTTTTKGILQGPGSAFYAISDFSGPVPALSPYNGYIQLRNLTINVSPDLSSILDIMNSLRDQIATLSQQIELLRAEHDEDIAALRGELGELRLRTVGPGPDVCVTTQPALDWVCVGGGWVPPDHPRAAAAETGAPVAAQPAVRSPGAPPPSTCPGVPPAVGWACVKGGWVPPDHPLARGGG